jgi:hypothetical protein
MSAIVYVTQIPLRRDKFTGVMTPSVNISPASEHGQIEILMPGQTSFFATGDLVAQLKEGLKDYDYERGDSVVCLGDPAIIAIVGAILSGMSEQFYVLRWDKNLGRYVKIKIKV